MIEGLFEHELWDTKIKKRTFDPTEKLKPKENYYGKNIFATEVISPNKAKINFDGFKLLFERMAYVQKHYKGF